MDVQPRSSRFVRILSVAGVEVRSIFRSHPFRVFVPAAVILVLATPELVLFAFHERDAMVAQVGISTAALFGTLVALLAGAAAVAGDRRTGRRDVLLAGALSPTDWIAGKWLGISVAAAFSVALLGGIHLASLLFRGGAPGGVGPLLAALVVAAVQASLAGAAALLFSSFLRPGPAFLAALLFFLAGHAAALLGDAPLADVARFLLPRTALLNLAGEAAFGPFRASLWLLAALHGFLYSLFLLALAVPVAGSWRKS